MHLFLHLQSIWRICGIKKKESFSLKCTCESKPLTQNWLCVCLLKSLSCRHEQTVFRCLQFSWQTLSVLTHSHTHLATFTALRTSCLKRLWFHTQAVIAQMSFSICIKFYFFLTCGVSHCVKGREEVHPHWAGQMWNWISLSIHTKVAFFNPDNGAFFENAINWKTAIVFFVKKENDDVIQGCGVKKTILHNL